MQKNKNIIVIIILLLVILVSYTVPRAKYIGTNFISNLEVPFTFFDWKGKDVSETLNVSAANTNFNFINEALAYQYVNSYRQNLIFIILDAGNFHHPKVCFTGAGYKIKELTDTEFNFSGQTLKAHTLFTTRDNINSLSFYWIVIDRNVAHEWIEQKYKQLFHSLFNKKRVGLMVRIDIPTKEDNIEEAMVTAKKFVNDLSQSLQPGQASYIFGEF